MPIDMNKYVVLSRAACDRVLKRSHQKHLSDITELLKEDKRSMSQQETHSYLVVRDDSIIFETVKRMIEANNEQK
jgi:hypothetical protein